MRQYNLLLAIITVSICSCSSDRTDGFNSIKLTSSTNDVIYINSVNWGVTGDNQISVITSDSDKLKYQSDTTNAIKGLMPFVYSFSQDTLRVYHVGDLSAKIPMRINGIVIQDSIVDNDNFSTFSFRAMKNDFYHYVPNVWDVRYPSNMPIPPKND